MQKGKKNWVFCDGYLPPKGDNPEFEGHEALMVTNLNDKQQRLSLFLYLRTQMRSREFLLNLTV